MKLNILIVQMLVALVCAQSSTLDRFQKIIFEDNFDEFDLSVWNHEITLGGGGNGEFEYYCNNRSNTYVKNGILYITPTLTSDTIGKDNVMKGFVMDLWGSQPADLCTGNSNFGCERKSGVNILNPIQSGRIRTVNSFNFKYGIVEVRAKLPRGDWLWPAIWMLPTYNSYGGWPASGEVDIMESRGNNASYPGGVNQISSTLHWGPFGAVNQWSKTHATFTLRSGDFADKFHIFRLEWTNTSISTFVDGQSVLYVPIKESFWEKGGWNDSAFDNPWQGRPNNAPFDQKFYLLFNLAVGGVNGYFPDGVGNKPWSNADPQAVNAFYSAIDQWYPTWSESPSLQIDYVKVYEV